MDLTWFNRHKFGFHMILTSENIGFNLIIFTRIYTIKRAVDGGFMPIN